MTIAAVIHQPSLSSFLMFDDLLLLGKGGRVVYHGPVMQANAYFANIGFPLPPNTNPADFYLDVAQGAVEREVGDANCSEGEYNYIRRERFDWMELFDMWEDHRLGTSIEAASASSTTSPLPSPSSRSTDQKRVSEASRSDSSHSLTRQSSVSALCRRDLLSADAQLESTKNASSIISNMPNIAHSAWCDAVHASSRYCSALLKDVSDVIKPTTLAPTFGATTGISSVVGLGAYSRVTPSPLHQFWLCFMRSLKQIFAGFRPFVSEMALHLVCGAVISTAANRLYFEGPLPSPVCAIQTYSLQGLCVLPQAAQYVQIGNLCVSEFSLRLSRAAALHLGTSRYSNSGLPTPQQSPSPPPSNHLFSNLFFPRFCY